MLLSSKYHCVRQQDAADCAPACLATIARQCGRHLSVSRARAAVRTDAFGSTALGVLEGAEKLGYRARGVEVEFDVLGELPLPAIAHWREHDLPHFVVVHKVRRRTVVIADPAVGIRVLSHGEFRRCWTRILLLVETDAAARDESVEPSTLGRAMRLLRPHRGMLAEAAISTLLFALLGLASSFFVEVLVDSITAGRDLQTIDVFAVGMLVVLLFRALLGALRAYFLLHVGQRVYAGLLSSYYRHLFALPMAFFDTRQVGELLSRLTDTARIRDVMSGTIAAAFVDGLMVIATMATITIFDSTLALVASATIPCYAALALIMRTRFGRSQRRTMEAGADLNALLVEAMSGAETIKALGAERAIVERSDDRLVPFLNGVFRTNYLGISTNTISALFTGLSNLIVLWIGAHRVANGDLSLGELMAVNVLVLAMAEPLERLVNATQSLQDGFVTLDRLSEVLDLPTESGTRSTQTLSATCRGEIVLDSVLFRYGTREAALNGVSLRIEPGTTTALVGPSGSGKSTIAKLIQGFYVPEAGSVMIDDIDVRLLAPAILRRQLAIVPQQAALFSGTIIDNIALGQGGAPDLTHVIGAAKLAGAHSFVSRLPDGYATILGEHGIQLSAGERQRLALARALYRDAPIIILDEVTSALDANAEEAIRETLQSLHGTHTIVIIAHRLSTVRQADQIVVLQNGRIVEQGSHASLTSRRGEYSEMWRRQIGDHVSRKEHAT